MSPQQPERPRVICIGWHKTGTTTIGLALLKLGYSVLGCRLDTVHALRRGELESVLALTDEFDAVQDVPWAALFEELDRRHPGSKFILTIRDEASWLASASRHFGDTDIRLHEWLYGVGVLEGNEDVYLERYRAHVREVREYFADRPDDLLVMDFQGGDGWSKLCEFLGDPIPKQPFPHENIAPDRLVGLRKVHFELRQLAPMWLRRLWFDGRMAVRRLQGLPDPRNRFNNFSQNTYEISRRTKS